MSLAGTMEFATMDRLGTLGATKRKSVNKPVVRQIAPATTARIRPFDDYVMKGDIIRVTLGFPYASTWYSSSDDGKFKSLLQSKGYNIQDFNSAGVSTLWGGDLVLTVRVPIDFSQINDVGSAIASIANSIYTGAHALSGYIRPTAVEFVGKVSDTGVAPSGSPASGTQPQRSNNSSSNSTTNYSSPNISSSDSYLDQLASWAGLKPSTMLISGLGLLFVLPFIVSPRR